MKSLQSLGLAACLAIAAPAPGSPQELRGTPFASWATDEIRRTLILDGKEREYFVLLPIDFEPTRRHRLLVAVHGNGGRGRNLFLASGARRQADDRALDVIVVAPSFRNDDPFASAFPSLGEVEFLERVIDALRDEYRLRQKILLTGYSRGGQFTHRFTFQNPELVEAAAPLAAGSWTTPDGQLLSPEFGIVEDPATFFVSSEQAARFPAQAAWFEPRIALAAAARARPGAQTIPFLVMVGTEDPRLGTTEEWARRMEAAGYAVETEWPRTPHSCYELDPAGDGLVWSLECETEFQDEFLKYPVRVVDFFVRATRQD